MRRYLFALFILIFLFNSGCTLLFSKTTDKKRAIKPMVSSPSDRWQWKLKRAENTNIPKSGIPVDLHFKEIELKLLLMFLWI